MLKKKVLAFIQKHKLILPGEKILVGVSGGPDSVCLLHLLWEIKDELDTKLTAAHLNHMLREEAEEDSQFVQKLCLDLNIPLILERIDVAGYRKRHSLSLEEAARIVRYDFLKRAAASCGADKVAVAHTADDQVETILLNLVRGAGIRGLKGMSPISSYNGVVIIRPLLEASRRETEEYCRINNLSPRQDLSNLDIRFRRNFIRHKLIPLILKLNPRFKEGLLSTSISLAQDLSFIESKLDEVEGGMIERIREHIRIDRRRLLELHPALRAHLLLRLGERRGVRLSAEHIRRAIKVIENPGKSLDLGGGLRLVVEQRYSWLTFSSPPCPYPELGGQFKLNIPGFTKINGWEVKAEVIQRSDALISDDPFVAHLDFDRSGGLIFVRPRRAGDKFYPLGMGVEKRLQDFMVDEKIPRSWRGRIPVVSSDKHILWVVGYRIDERAKITPTTTKVLKLEFRLGGC